MHCHYSGTDQLRMPPCARRLSLRSKELLHLFRDSGKTLVTTLKLVRELSPHSINRCLQIAPRFSEVINASDSNTHGSRQKFPFKCSSG